MARTASWLLRVHEIEHCIHISVRSHYDRHDLQKLFQLQPRAAQKMFEMMPTVEAGNAQWIERDQLLTFLQKVKDTDNPTLLFETLRQEKQIRSRNKPQQLIRSDFVTLPLTSLPQSIKIIPGRLEVSFETVYELAESLMQIAGILTHEADLFAARYEPKKEPESDLIDEAEDLRRIFAELEEMEKLKEQELQAQANAGEVSP